MTTQPTTPSLPPVDIGGNVSGPNGQGHLKFRASLRFGLAFAALAATLSIGILLWHTRGTIDASIGTLLGGVVTALTGVTFIAFRDIFQAGADEKK